MFLEDFFIKAIIAGIGVAITTSMVGVFVLWKKMAYFGDAISHSSLFGLAFASIIAVLPIYGVIFCSLLFTLLIYLLSKQNIYSKDTIIGIISYCILAIGMILIAIFPNNINLESYLFGDIIAITRNDIITIYVVCALSIIAIYFWFNKLLLSTINQNLAKISGINSEILELKFLLLVALVVASLVKIVGIFLMTSMLIMPAAIARNFAKTPLQMLSITIFMSIFVVISGLIIAIFADLPSGPAIIAFASFILLLSILLRRH